MSIKRMVAIWEGSQHDGSALLLLLALADHAKDNGVCWPGYESLAHKSRTSRRNLPRLIQKLTDSGEVWAINRRRHQSNLYVVTPGLELEGKDSLESAVEMVLKMGAVSTRGSEELAIPPQVLEVVTGWHYLDPIQIVSSAKVALGSVLLALPKGQALAPEPSLSVIETEEDIIWKAVLDELALQMTKQTFDSWRRGSRVRSVDNGLWTVELGSVFAVDWVHNRLRPVVERTVARHREGVRLDFVAKGA